MSCQRHRGPGGTEGSLDWEGWTPGGWTGLHSVTAGAGACLQGAPGTEGSPTPSRPLPGGPSGTLRPPGSVWLTPRPSSRWVRPPGAAPEGHWHRAGLPPGGRAASGSGGLLRGQSQHQDLGPAGQFPRARAGKLRLGASPATLRGQGRVQATGTPWSPAPACLQPPGPSWPPCKAHPARVCHPGHTPPPPWRGHLGPSAPPTPRPKPGKHHPP